jgi:hypothetical protein
MTHPWLGPLWVRVQGWSLSESNGNGGFATVKIDFVAGGEVRQTERDYYDAAQAACRGAAIAAVEDFEMRPMSSDALQSYTAAVHRRLDGLRQIVSLAALPLMWAQSVMTVIAGVETELAELTLIPRAYADAALGIAHALGLSTGDGRQLPADLKPASRAGIVGRIGKAAGTSRKAITLTGASAADVTLLANLRAEYALEQRLFACAALSLAVADYPFEADRNQALAAVEKAVTRLLPATQDDVYQALVTARAAVIEALLNQSWRPTVRRNIVRPLPAVLIAHGLGIGEDEFLQRNNVRHPLFVNGEVYG